ncbi:hypothetical protein [Pseudomonas ovata]|uniref:hypothetical protein n=1 Tax=Pseudomonas ovata TaxID=1839709 RepID=UPI000D6991F6|nr:hypothetical protein [Pseudomonas ovata]
MTIEDNGPEAAYPGPAEQSPDTGGSHGSGIEQAASEPKQGTGQGQGVQQRPEDWNPPPGNPGSDQDAQTNRENGSARTDSLIDEE